MNALRAFWDWLIDRRRVAHLTRDEIRAFAILNIVCLMALVSIGIVSTLIMLAPVPFTGVRFDLAQNAASFLLYGIGWIIVRRGSAVLGSVMLSLFGNLQITLLVFYYGYNGGIQWYYGVLMAAPLVTIPGPRPVLRLLLSALPLALYSWTIYEYRILGRVAPAVQDPNVTIFFFTNSLSSLLLLGAIVAYFRYAALNAEAELETERRRSDALLLNILPGSIASRLKGGETLIADRFESATVLFADLVGFTQMAQESPPEDVIRVLDEIFSRFDEAAMSLGLEKVKTIGDAYMVIGGAPEQTANHAERMVRLGMSMLAIVREVGTLVGRRLEVRIGIHSGTVIGGVIGKNKFAYDFWGDTVNTASRMESHGVPGRIHVTEATVSELGGLFLTEERGPIEVKGKGSLRTYFVAPHA